MRINEEITAPRVRLVGDNVPEQGIISTSEALKKAEELGLDLVEITAKVDPPVCKIIDYQKYLYQQKKRAKEMKANSTKVVIKEIEMSESEEYVDALLSMGYTELVSDGNNVSVGRMLQRDTVTLSVSYSDGVLGILITLSEK